MFTKSELEILFYALSSPVGVPAALRSDAETLRQKLRHFLMPATPPKAPLIFTPIRSAWPDNPTLRSKKFKWDSELTEDSANEKIAKQPLTVDDVLEGLI